MDLLSDSFKLAAKLNVVFGFFLKIDIARSSRYCIAPEINTLTDRSELVTAKKNFAQIENFVVIKRC